MSACDVCLGGADGHSEFYYDRKYVARKKYKCAECRTVIQIGDEYRRIGGKYEGDMWHSLVCVACYEINTVFSCDNGTEWGALWESMWDYVFPDLTVSSPCFNKLSLMARAKVTEQWWKWKEWRADQ